MGHEEIMKKLLLTVVLASICIISAFAAVKVTRRSPRRHMSTFQATSYPLVIIHDIQFVPEDSLLIADSLGYTTGARWTLQTSSYNNDTVTVVVLVTVPARVISYNNDGLTLAVVDTGILGTQPWGGILVRYPNTNDSTDFEADGYFDVEQGDVIEMTGVVNEFPLSQMNSITQFAPVPHTQVKILSSGNPVPPPVHLTISDFNTGTNPGGKIQFSTGEPWESQYVYFTNVTVVTSVNTSRGTFMFTDGTNQLSDYDWSYHFTLPLSQAQPTTPADTAYKVPPAGTVIDTIRGYIATSSGGESARGYRICPMWPGDIVYLTPSLPILNFPVSGSLNQALSPFFSWSGNAATYHLQLSKDSSFTLIVYDDSTITTNSLQVNPLQSNTLYYWRVKGQNVLASSQWSATWHFTTYPVNPPNLTAPPNGSANQPLFPMLSWNAIPHISSYRLQVATDTGFSSIAFDNSTITTTSIQIGMLAGNITYYWHVMTLDSGSTSTWSATWHFFTGPALNPAYKVYINGPIYAGPSILGTGVLYVIGTGDAIYRLDSTGNILYSLKVGGNVISSSSISYDTVVYIGSSDNNLYAFSKYGNAVWPPLPLGGAANSTPVIDSITNRLYIGVSNKNFVAINRSTGIVSWNYFADAPISSSAGITPDRKLVFATVKGTIYGFDLTSSAFPPTPAWQLALSDSVYSSPAVDDGGYIYYCTTSGKVFKISMPQLQQATVVWQAQTGGSITGSPVIDGYGSLYVGCSDSNLYAINVQNGNIKWTYHSGSPILSTPAVSDIGMIYFGNHGGEVAALDTNATPHWFYQDSTSVDAPLLYEGGTLYVGTVGARLLAFKAGAGSSASAATSKNAESGRSNAVIKPPVWGTFQGNNQRTGVFSRSSITKVNSQTNLLPTQYSLSQNYPNPFNPSAKISYQLPKSSFVTLKVYDIIGREVSLLVNEKQNAGTYEVTFDASHLASGVYFYRIQVGPYINTKKLLLLK